MVPHESALFSRGCTPISLWGCTLSRHCAGLCPSGAVVCPRLVAPRAVRDGGWLYHEKFCFFLQTEGNLSRVNDILYDVRARLWDEVARCSECMWSPRVSLVPDLFGDRPSGMPTL